MVRLKSVLNKILNYFIKRKKIKNTNIIMEDKYKYVLTKSDYENEDILDQLFESNSYE